MLLLDQVFIWILTIILTESIQFNLHLTSSRDETENSTVFSHNCLYRDATNNDKGPYQIIPFCLSEWRSEWNIKQNTRDQNFTFAELHQRNVTVQQLYLWSAPIDLIELYQLYRLEVLNSNASNLGHERFYNCTLPWFGAKCQFMFHNYQSYHSSFNDIVRDFYLNRDESNTMTCYTSLQCVYHSKWTCLDWTEICDGKIDCLDGGRDEENCWQIDISDCPTDEYRCPNGQCIPIAFLRDDPLNPDCIDGLDEKREDGKSGTCTKTEPIFRCEEAKCLSVDTAMPELMARSSCVKERGLIILREMLSIKKNSTTDLCWSAMLCVSVFMVIHSQDITCWEFCKNHDCKRIIAEQCSNFIRIPETPAFYGHVSLIYDAHKAVFYPPMLEFPVYLCYDAMLCNELKPTVILPNFDNDP